jgi:hypothetical protein
MANVNAPFGFKPIAAGIGGGPWFIRKYGKAASQATYGIFRNDLVMIDSPATPVVDSETGRNLPGCKAAQGTPGSIYYLGASLNYGAVSTATEHYVVDDPGALYMAQVDSVTSITTALHANKNANALLTAGDAVSKQSKHTVNHTGIAVTAGLDMRIQKISDIAPNAEGVYAVVEVLILKHVLGPGQAGI